MFEGIFCLLLCCGCWCCLECLKKGCPPTLLLLDLLENQLEISLGKSCKVGGKVLETLGFGTNTAVSSESSDDISTNSIYVFPFLENKDFSPEE